MRRWRWHGMRTWLSPATTVSLIGSARHRGRTRVIEKGVARVQPFDVAATSDPAHE
jgi:hypothetical protein